MIKYILWGLLAFLVKDGVAQTVPNTVAHAFEKKFPDAKFINWEEQNGLFKAGFLKANKKMAAIFGKNGNLLETQLLLIANDLPYNVTNYIENKCSDTHIKSVIMIIKGNKKIYEVEIKEKELQFDERGAFLKEQNSND